jgi:hypothetical protein
MNTAYLPPVPAGPLLEAPVEPRAGVKPGIPTDWAEMPD